MSKPPNTQRAAQRLIQSVPPVRNPGGVPLIGSWLGHRPTILSAAELATLWSPPTARTIDRIDRIPARWLTPPADAFIDPDDPTNLLLGHGLKADSSWAPIGFSYDKLRYVLWATAPMGRGKSVWLQHLFGGLMRAGAGCMTLDCKGTDLVNDSLPLVPLNREQDVVILNLGGTGVTGEDLRIAMNLLSPRLGASLGVEPSMLASTIMTLFSTLDPNFDQAVGIQQFAKMGLLALLEGEPNATLMHLIKLFGDAGYRAQVMANVENMQVADFWLRRFEEMPETQKSSLASFERRIDMLLTFPELANMLITPDCSINLRHMMDNQGILLAGIKASEGQIAAIAGTLLLTQMTMAALSRTNIPVAERQHWPVIIDEAQIVFGQNPGMAAVMFSQLRAFHIGQVVVHQNIGQLPPEVLTPLAGNAQYRVILGSEADDAGRYGTQYRAQGVNAGDFTMMERFQHQYFKFLGTNLFSSRMLPMPQPVAEEPPPPVDADWRTVQAPTTSAEDQAFDELQAELRSLLHENTRATRQQAVKRLGTIVQQRPDRYAAYCARTAAHRQTQRQFILDNPGCISDKGQRIHILSALVAGRPRLESAALQYALLDPERPITPPAKGKKGKGKGSGGDRATTLEGLSLEQGEPGERPIIHDRTAAEELRRRRDPHAPAEGFEA